MSEDCLFLNIYAPATREEALAVMIWIHGGGGEGGGRGLFLEPLILISLTP